VDFRRFTEAQIIAIVREYDVGTSVAESARKHGIHANTIRLWKSKYNGMEVADVVRLKELEADDGRMQRTIAKLHAGSTKVPDALIFSQPLQTRLRKLFQAIQELGALRVPRYL
jgi:putative transposase